ncbi:MAG: glycosyltransferase family 4 protein [Methanosarcinaceae archaeon]|nr:glycosyltransferase family 4 protein [Methanosarcinaceae archaeon]
MTINDPSDVMTIAFVSIEYPPRLFGGLGAYITDITDAFTGLGHDMIIATPNENNSLPVHEIQGGGEGECNVKDNLDNVKGEIEVFRQQSLSDRDTAELFLSQETWDTWGDMGVDFLCDLLSYNHLAASRIVELMRNGRSIDICVGHDWLDLPAAMTIKKETGIPTIYHVHSTEAGRSLGNLNPQIQRFENRSANYVDALITVSNAMKDELVSMGVPQDKIYVCYNGVDVKRFDPENARPSNISKLRKEYGIGESDRVVLFIGRLEEVKGAAKLVLAMPDVLEKYPDTKLVLVGKGTQEGLIRGMISDNHLESSVLLNTDYLPDDEKIDHYAMSDVCVFPSFYEPFGIVAIEAMAMEKSVVVGARGTSGLREIVVTPPSDNPTGMHVNPHDPQDIAWGITEIFDSGYAKVWGKNGRKRVLEMFTWEVVSRQTLDVYRNVIAKVERV